jgi:Fur family ferric uptake transcriptional regulator
MRVTEQLNNVGLKATGPRMKVLQVFHAHEHHHMTAEDVHRHMVDLKADVGLATVYRVLGQLTDVGILSRHVFESGKAVYEIHKGKHHDHLICLGCGRVDEFFDDVIEERQRAIAQSSGYTLAQHQLALYGFCPQCRAKRDEPRPHKKKQP